MDRFFSCNCADSGRVALSSCCGWIFAVDSLGFPPKRETKANVFGLLSTMYNQFVYHSYCVHYKKGSYRGMLTYCQVEDILRDSGFPMVPAFADAFRRRYWSFHFE